MEATYMYITNRLLDRWGINNVTLEIFVAKTGRERSHGTVKNDTYNVSNNYFHFPMDLI